ncbi:hypothetical protein [Idiomarina sp. UBA4206]|uniref:hypothetical protein n=1 Tax=Idiomarina sp. UBA4206 TaxID=1946644 RepID=UPI00257CEA59|nr:hypothetical protein [Idiomarina sp. UBA4206]
MFKLSILLVLSMILTSCAGIYPGRSFIDEMDRDSDGAWVAGRDFPTVAGDSGQAYRGPDEIARRTPASAFAKEQSEAERSINNELKHKISTLDEPTYAQYLKDKTVLSSASEEIYYLSLSPYEKAEYVRLKQAGGEDKTVKPYAYLSNYKDEGNLSLRSFYQSRYEERALKMGMNKQDVVASWGEPQNVDYAGDPRFQNERWSFREQGKVHRVYFENGVVHGWAVD